MMSSTFTHLISAEAPIRLDKSGFVETVKNLSQGDSVLDLLSGREHAILDIDVRTVHLGSLIDDPNVEILLCGSFEDNRKHFFIAGGACRLLTPECPTRQGATIECPSSLRDQYAVFYALTFSRPIWCEIGPVQCGLDRNKYSDFGLQGHTHNTHAMIQPQNVASFAYRRALPAMSGQGRNEHQNDTGCDTYPSRIAGTL